MEVIEEESHRNWLGRDFPGPVVNNPFSNAAGGGGGAVSVPGWGTKIPHDMGQLNLCVTTPGPMPQLERSLCAPTKRPRNTMKEPRCCNRNPAGCN